MNIYLIAIYLVSLFFFARSLDFSILKLWLFNIGLDWYTCMIDWSTKSSKKIFHSHRYNSSSELLATKPKKKNVSKNVAKYIYYKWLISVSEFVSMMEKPSTTSNNTWWCLSFFFLQQNQHDSSRGRTILYL